MAKTDRMLKAFQQNLGNWTCAYCTSGSSQAAATFRELKKLGYSFEETSTNRWARNLHCDNCETQRTHYKLLQREPVHKVKPRITISPKTRKRLLKLFEFKDAFSGASISSTPEIDHKIPWTLLEQDIDVNAMEEVEIKKNFQLLTREHNLLKDRACMSCIKTKERPPFFGIRFWYKGSDTFDGDCEGCGWHDGEKWRAELNRKVNGYN